MLLSLRASRPQRRFFIAIAAVALFLLVIIAYYNGSIRKTVVQWVDVDTTHKEQKLRRCLNGVVTVAPGGRFGNAFMEAASAWAVARTHNLTLATPTALRNTLQRAFRRAPLGLSLADLLAACPRAHAPTAHAATRATNGGVEEEKETALSEKDVLSLQVDTSKVSAAATSLVAALASGAEPGPLVVGTYAVLFPYIIPLADELRAQVEWQDHLHKKAQKKLHQFGKATAEIVGEPVETVVFVGVHVRRTDYPAWLRNRAHTTLEADAAFYARAVARLRRDLDDPATGGGPAGPLAIVMVSDDMPWVRATLLPQLNATAKQTGRMAAFAGGAGDAASTLEDLALLSACNHTVFAYGTYGMTAAILTGGRVVAFDLYSSYPSTQATGLDLRWTVLR